MTQQLPPMQAAQLALDQIDRAEETGLPQDLRQAITATALAISHFPDGDETQAFLLMNLCDLHLVQHRMSGDVREVEAAEACSRAAIERAAPGSPSREMPLRGYWRTHINSPVEMARTVRVHDTIRLTIDFTTSNTIPEEDRLEILQLMYGALDARYSASNNIEDLDSCILSARTALEVRGYSAKSWEWIGRLVVSLQQRAEYCESIENANESVFLGQQIIKLLPPGHDHIGVLRAEYASALRVRHFISDEIEDLNSALDASRLAISELRGEALWMVRQNLANMLAQRYRMLGTQADLLEAVKMSEEDLPDTEDAAAARINIANIQLQEALSSVDLTDFVKAASTARLATKGAQHLPEIRSAAFGLLTTILLMKLQIELANNESLIERPTREQRNCLEEALACAKEAYSLTPKDHALASERLMDVARAYETQFDYLHNRHDIDESVEILSRLQEATQSESDRLAADLNLGVALSKRYRRYVNERDAIDAIVLLKRSCYADSPDTQLLLTAATSWAELEAAIMPASSGCVAAYERSIDLVRELAWVGAAEADAFRRLSRWPAVATSAAACHISAGNLIEAITALERGRAIVWHTLFRPPLDLAQLALDAPALAIDLVGQQERMKEIYSAPVGAISTDERVQRMAQWQRSLAQAAEIDGRLGRVAFDYDSLVEGLPVGGHVVVVNVDKLRVDALLVSKNGVRRVHLPATPEEVRRNVLKYQDSLSGRVRTPLPLRNSRERTVAEVLNWLWTTVVAPIAEEIDLPQDGKARIWWCPTGLLALLPIHAAGVHRRHGTKQTDGLIELAISSYIPTLDDLARSSYEDVDATSVSEQPTLVVGVPQSRIADVSDLPNVTVEVNSIKEILGSRCEVLFAQEATVENTARAVTRATWVHFTCHGRQDIDEPTGTGLALYDGYLTIQEMVRNRTSGELAFLSACDTAVGSLASADEAISLVGALKYSGWANVVGSLGPVRDDIATVVASEFYELLTRDSLTVANGIATNRTNRFARSLHEATCRMREMHPDAPSLWSPFVHFGR